MCTGRCLICGLIALLPIVVFVVVITAYTSTLSRHSQSQTETHETSNMRHSPNSKCHITGTMSSPLIYVGSIENPFFSEALITQDTPSPDYLYVDMEIFTVPSQNLIQYPRKFNCGDRGNVELRIDGIYLRKDMKMTFNITVQSTDVSNPGWADIAFYDDLKSWSDRNSGGHVIKSHRFPVNAGKTETYNYEFVSTHDSYYYIMLGAYYQCNNSEVVFYSVDTELKDINSSDWLKTSHRTVCNRTQTKCLAQTPKDTSWIFSTTKYDIFARVTTTTEDNDMIYGHLSLTPQFRMAVYALPTVIGLIILIPLEVVCAIVSLCFCFCCSRKQMAMERKPRMEECEEFPD